jgi:hypothetical protein
MLYFYITGSKHDYNTSKESGRIFDDGFTKAVVEANAPR